MFKDYTGFGALSEALTKLDAAIGNKVWVVASASGWERFCPFVSGEFFARREVRVFSHFSVNPDFGDIYPAAADMRAWAPDCIIAIGGGSAIDTAKTLKAAAYTAETVDPANPGAIRVSGAGPALVAIPTTAGSGSEATQFAVVYTGEKKHSVSHPTLRPDVAVVDPELVYSLSAHQTASTGFDALCHALEAYWASGTTPEAQKFAASSVRYILPHFVTAVNNPGPVSRMNMSIAAYNAGRAINITLTTLAHALSYHITKRYGVPHGHAAALILPFCFLQADQDARGHMHGALRLLDQNSPREAFAFWRQLMRACGLAPTLREAGLDSADKLRALVASADPERLGNYPVRVDPQALAALLADNDSL